MKLIPLISVLALAFILLPLQVKAEEAMQPTKEALENLKPFPEKLDNMERFVIFMEPRENEDALQVELMAGKTLEVDCNRHNLLGQFTEKNVEGWGYTYFTFETEGRIASTLMACPGPKSERFIQAQGLMTRYNSRLPLVVYVQQGHTLQYRIWSAGPELQAEKQ